MIVCRPALEILTRQPVLHAQAAAPGAARVRRERVKNDFVLAQRPGLNALRSDPGLIIAERDIHAFRAVFEKIPA